MDEKGTIDRASHRFKWLVLGYLGGSGISAITTIILARLMGPSGYGLYAAAFLISALMTGMHTLGMESATTFFVAKYFKNMRKLADSYFKTAIVFIIVYALVLSGLLSLSADILARYIFGKPVLARFFRISSFLMMTAAINSVVGGGLIARGEHRTVALFILMIASTRNAVALLLYINFADPFYALLGQVIGSLLAGGIYWSYTYLEVSKGEINKPFLMNMMRYAVPYGIGAFAMSVCTQIFNLVAAITYDSFVYGNFSAAWFILSGIMVVPSSLSTSFFPSFTEAEIKHTNLSPIYNSAVKFSATLLLYLWLIFGSLSDFFVNIIYGSKYTLASTIFSLLSSVFILSILGWGIINPLLLSLRKTKTLAAISVTSVATSLFVYYLLSLKAPSALWTIPAAYFILHTLLTVLGLIYLKKHYNLSLDRATIIKFFLVIAVLFVFTREMGFAIGGILMSFIGLQLSSVITIFVSLVIIGAMYIFILLLIGVLRHEDYERIRNAFFKWYLNKFADRIASSAIRARGRLNGTLIARIVGIESEHTQKVSQEED